MKPFILVVDDDVNTASLICEHLEKQGYRVTHCHDAAQALIQAEGMPVGLVITDIVMPVYGSGLDAYVKIRKNPKFPQDLPIIFLTGLKAAEAERLIPKGDPRVRLLHKPTTMAKLLDAIRELTGETLKQGKGSKDPK